MVSVVRGGDEARSRRADGVVVAQRDGGGGGDARVDAVSVECGANGVALMARNHAEEMASVLCAWVMQWVVAGEDTVGGGCKSGVWGTGSGTGGGGRKLGVENLVQIPTESKGISDGGCDVPLCDNPTPLEAFKEHSETIVDSNNDSTSSNDDYPYGEDIDYVDASLPDSEIVSLEVVEIVIPEVGGIDTDILLTIKDDILCEKLLNVNLLITNIEALKDNSTPSSDIVTKSSSKSLNLFLEETNTFDNLLIESETFCFDLEENSSGSTTTHSDYSLPDYAVFYLNDDHIEEKSSGSTTTHADFSLPKYDSFIIDLSIIFSSC
ncbi:hypothetical protein Tco_0454268 [Tanacetum coccineum]